MKRAIFIYWVPLTFGLLLLLLLFFFRERILPFPPLHWGPSNLLAHKILPLKGGSTLFAVTKVKEAKGIIIEIHSLPLKSLDKDSSVPILEKRFFLHGHQDSFLEKQKGNYSNLVFIYNQKGSPPSILVPTLNAQKKAQLTLYQWNHEKKDFQASIINHDFYKELKKPSSLGTEGTIQQ